MSLKPNPKRLARHVMRILGQDGRADGIEADSGGVLELSTDNIESYLRERGVIDGGPAVVETLGWGISNAVFKVRTRAGCVVVKQPSPRLRVDAVWEWDRSRILVERDCMAYLGGILPVGAVPTVRFSDETNFVLGMSCAPSGGVLWKEALLRGEIDIGAARRAGALLAEIQTKAAADPIVRERFAEQAGLVQGRIDPYHRAAAAANPCLRSLIEQEIERMRTTDGRSCLATTPLRTPSCMAITS